jgi:hypothetical protein
MDAAAKKDLALAHSAEQEAQEVKERILHILSVYPQISQSMLQISLGMPVASWKPVLEHLIKGGEVLRDTVVINAPSGRMQTHTIIRLTETELRLNQDAVI